MGRPFIKGIELGRRFYWEAVRPVLDEHFPGLKHSAALIGAGSEVLGFDTPQSTDHNWGPRVLLFLAPEDTPSMHNEIDAQLRHGLPPAVSGFPTNFGLHEDGAATMAPAGDDGPIEHEVGIHTVSGYFGQALGFDASMALGPTDWLSVPENVLRMLTGGAVYHDGLGSLEPLREKLRYYPRDVWLYLLAAQWARIGQEEAFPGRCAQVGDDLGSRLVTARLVRDIMRLAFLMEQTYAPYIKWFGTAFQQLDCAGELLPALQSALSAHLWEDREAHLDNAYESIARLHNGLEITPRLDPHVSRFHSRPFQVIHADRFAEAVRAQIVDPQVLGLPQNLGSVDQIVDSTDALRYLGRLRGVYEA
jgi:hypothetical protein